MDQSIKKNEKNKFGFLETGNPWTNNNFSLLSFYFFKFTGTFTTEIGLFLENVLLPAPDAALDLKTLTICQ